MADLLIAPEGYTTPGGVPRMLLAGVFIVVSLTAMGVFLLTSRHEPLMTGDQRARAELRKPESVTAQQKGHAAWVDDAADHAQAERPAVPAVSPATPVAAPADAPRPVANLRNGEKGAGPAPLPGGVEDTASQQQAEIDSAAVERERAARTAAATVFDDGTQAVAAKADAVADTAGDVLRQVTGRPPADAASFAPVIDAIKATHGQAPALSRADGDRQWAQQAGAGGRDDMLRARLPHAPWTLYQGTVIPCVLTRRINSDMPGVVTARVSMDVYDSRTSRRLLLPKGALLVGAYNSDVKQGQSRLQFAFTKLKLPDGSTFDLPGAQGSDAAGQSGVSGDVNRHFFRSFGAALLLGVLADRVTKATALPNAGASGQGGVSATGQVFVDTARAELDRHRGIPPTVTVEEGTRLNVEVVRDMGFPAESGEQAPW